MTAEQQASDSAPWRTLYTTPRWRKLRKAILLRDLFTCNSCRRLEGDSSLLVADHIRPHRGNMLLFWDESNLQTLCKTCHDTLKRKEEQESIHQRGTWY
jgi:5-methylcytosine-specific restriction protein A